jgi:hypothetical protein
MQAGTLRVGDKDTPILEAYFKDENNSDPKVTIAGW